MENTISQRKFNKVISFFFWGSILLLAVAEVVWTVILAQ